MNKIENRNSQDDLGMLPIYVYEALPATTHTRILEIQPSMCPDAPLQCTLQLLNLDEDPVYEALSYTWGMPSLTEEVVLDQNFSKPITKNLHEALRRFRKEIHVRRIWVDALCINQEDPLDKARQIPIMGEVYRRASTVLAWLGNDEMTEATLKRIDYLARIKRSKSDVDQIHSQAMQDALIDLARVPWLYRRWIIQEVVLNANVLLFAGCEELPWARLAQAQAGSPLNSVPILPYLIDLWMSMVLQSTIPNSLWFRSSRSSQSKTPHVRICDLLRVFDRCECADPRDRIFAFSSISTDVSFSQPQLLDVGQDDGRKAFEIDYTMSTEQVYAKFARHLIESGAADLPELLGDLKASQTIHENWVKDLPSWAPDWRILRDNRYPGKRERAMSLTLIRTILNPDSTHLTLHWDPSYYPQSRIILGSEPFPRSLEPEAVYSWLVDTYARLRMVIGIKRFSMMDLMDFIHNPELPASRNTSSPFESSSIRSSLANTSIMTQIATTVRGRRILIGQERDIHRYYLAYAQAIPRLPSRNKDDSRRWARIVIANENVGEGDTLCFNDFVSTTDNGFIIRPAGDNPSQYRFMGTCWITQRTYRIPYNENYPDTPGDRLVGVTLI